MIGSPVTDDQLEDWVSAYKAELLSHVARMVGSADDAEDVLQSVWLRVRERPPANDNERSWFFRVATNAALDRLRTERRRTRLLAVHQLQQESEAPTAGEWLDDAGRDRVRECCMRLPRKQRDAVWHRWIEQEDYETVAARLGVTIETARANVYHGLKRLRRELEDLWSQENE